MSDRYDDRLGSHLNEDKRVTNKPVAKRKIYADDRYEVLLYIYQRVPGEPAFSDTDLLAALITYKEDRLRLLVKLQTLDAQGNYEKAFHDYVAKLNAEGTSPLRLIRSAKSWCGIPLTQNDMVVLLDAGLDAHKILKKEK